MTTSYLKVSIIKKNGQVIYSYLCNYAYLYYLLNNPEELNVYSYCLNNPLKNMDIAGLKSEECCYERNWNSNCCISRGPKLLDRDCFLMHISENFPQYLIGIYSARIIAKVPRVGRILAGVIYAAMIHRIYTEGYLKCLSCPPTKKKY